MAKKIYIGRNPQCDFCIPQNYDRVSNNHAEIEEKDGHLFFIDHSSNGSVVNGRRVSHSQIEIFHGDDIRLANSYQLSWSTIRHFFPVQQYPTRPMQDDGRSGRPTQLYNTPVRHAHIDYPSVQSDESYKSVCRNNNEYQGFDDRREIDHAKSSWSWGAFLLGWIWAVGHGIVWPLFVILGLAFILVLLPIIFPPVLIITVSINNLLAFALNIYLGAKGNTLAWENGCFESVEHFKSRERKWTIVALVIYGILLLGVIVSFIIGLSVLSTLFSF